MSLKTKYLLRHFCKYVYYAGYGNFWYEDIYKETLIYRIYHMISFAIYTTQVFLENLAAWFGKFPSVEKNSALMFAGVHTFVLLKIYLFLYRKDSIRKLNFEMGSAGDSFEKEPELKKQYWKVKWGNLFYLVSVYVSVITYGAQSARRAVTEDRPFYTVVTYPPRYDDDSVVAKFFRIFFYFSWFALMHPMVSADCLPISHLIIMSYKFATLCHHYKRIREEFDKDLLTMPKDIAIEKWRTGYLEGIKVHQKLLYLVKEINRVFGIIMSVQVCESSAVAVLLLQRLALSPHLDFLNALMTYAFVASLFYLLALNLWNAGEITYQASLLSHSMFYSGWHVCKFEKDKLKEIRHMIIIGCAQAQKPLILKAFGIQDLSYATFVSVARMTYSIFALFYQRRESA